jgi:hypothetical protein
MLKRREQWQQRFDKREREGVDGAVAFRNLEHDGTVAVCTCMCLCIYVCMYVGIYKGVDWAVAFRNLEHDGTVAAGQCVCVYVCMLLYMYVCMYVCLQLLQACMSHFRSHVVGKRIGIIMFTWQCTLFRNYHNYMRTNALPVHFRSHLVGKSIGGLGIGGHCTQGTVILVKRAAEKRWGKQLNKHMRISRTRAYVSKNARICGKGRTLTHVSKHAYTHTYTCTYVYDTHRLPAFVAP